MNKKVLFAVVFTVFVDLLGFGILLPVIPQLLANPASPFYLLPHGVSLKMGYIILGFLTAIFPFMQFLATPILGELSDRFGRKPVLAFSLFGTSLSYVIFAMGVLTRNLPLLFIARAFDGLTGGNIAVAQAAIADVSTPENRAKNFGLIGAAFGVGFILGPYLGGKLSDPTFVSWFNASTPFWFAAGLAFVNTLSVIFLLPETLKEKSKTLALHLGKSFQNIRKAFSLPNIRAVFSTVFLFQGGFTFFTTFFSVFLITKFAFNQGDIGNYFAYVGLWIAFSQAVITRQVTKRFNEQAILRVSLIGTGIFVLAQFIPSASWGLLLVVPFFAMFNGLSQANLTSLASRSAGSEMQGEILGINASVMALAQSIPPILSGFLAASIGARVPIFVSGIVIILAGIVFIFAYSKTSSVILPYTTSHKNKYMKKLLIVAGVLIIVLIGEVTYFTKIRTPASIFNSVNISVTHPLPVTENAGVSSTTTAHAGTTGQVTPLTPPAILTYTPMIITQANNNSIVHVKVGSRFTLQLGDMRWNISLSDPGIVNRVPNFAMIRGAQGIYSADKQGVTTLSAEGRPTCNPGEMCAQYIIIFSITIVVE